VVKTNHINNFTYQGSTEDGRSSDLVSKNSYTHVRNRKTSFDDNFDSFASPKESKASNNELPPMLEAIAEDINEENSYFLLL
jgi:hypothetical protein